MKNKLTILSSISLILILLTGNPAVAQYDVPLNLSVGDNFEYTIQIASNSLTINGTDYSESVPTEVPYSFDVTVDNIDEDPNGPGFFQTSATYVNYTVDDGSTTETGSSFVDTWETLYFIFVLIAALGGTAVPEAGDFEEPESDSVVDETSDVDGLPIFANSNTTYYQELANEPNVDVKYGNFYNVDKYDYGIFTDLDGDIFTTRIYLDASNSTQIDGISVEYETQAALEIVIDKSLSIIQEMYIEVGSYMKYGSATSESRAISYFGLTSVIDADKYSNGYFDNLDDSGDGDDDDGDEAGLPVNPIFVSFGILSMVAIVRIHRKNN